MRQPPRPAPSLPTSIHPVIKSVTLRQDSLKTILQSSASVRLTGEERGEGGVYLSLLVTIISQHYPRFSRPYVEDRVEWWAESGGGVIPHSDSCRRWTPSGAVLLLLFSALMP